MTTKLVTTWASSHRALASTLLALLLIGYVPPASAVENRVDDVFEFVVNSGNPQVVVAAPLVTRCLPPGAVLTGPWHIDDAGSGEPFTMRKVELGAILKDTGQPGNLAQAARVITYSASSPYSADSTSATELMLIAPNLEQHATLELTAWAKYFEHGSDISPAEEVTETIILVNSCVASECPMYDLDGHCVVDTPSPDALPDVFVDIIELDGGCDGHLSSTEVTASVASADVEVAGVKVSLKLLPVTVEHTYFQVTCDVSMQPQLLAKDGVARTAMLYVDGAPVGPCDYTGVFPDTSCRLVGAAGTAATTPMVGDSAEDGFPEGVEGCYDLHTSVSGENVGLLGLDSVSDTVDDFCLDFGIEWHSEEEGLEGLVAFLNDLQDQV